MDQKKVVVIGGGTGSSLLLRGLRKYPLDLAVIVSAADDGGSTGRLREELDVFPPGDARQCLAALADPAAAFQKVMNYRFEKGVLDGHSFGNLFLAALEKTSGSFEKGLEAAEKILCIKGKVVPASPRAANLFVRLKNGKLLVGENEVSHNLELEKVGVKKIYLAPRVKASARALEEIRAADLIVIGPGNHYCSILPNFLVSGISEAIRKSKALVVYNCNLVNRVGQTEKFTLDDYVDSINRQIGSDRIDAVTFNTKKPQPSFFANEFNEKLWVKINKQRKRNSEYLILAGDFLRASAPSYDKADRLAAERAPFWHDGEKLARALILFLRKSNR